MLYFPLKSSTPPPAGRSDIHWQQGLAHVAGPTRCSQHTHTRTHIKRDCTNHSIAHAPVNKQARSTGGAQNPVDQLNIARKRNCRTFSATKFATTITAPTRSNIQAENSGRSSALLPLQMMFNSPQRGKAHFLQCLHQCANPLFPISTGSRRTKQECFCCQCEGQWHHAFEPVTSNPNSSFSGIEALQKALL